MAVVGELLIALSVLTLPAVVWWCVCRVLAPALARYGDAVLATLTAEAPLPIGPPEPPVIDVRDMTDSEFHAEVLRRYGTESEEQT